MIKGEPTGRGGICGLVTVTQKRGCVAQMATEHYKRSRICTCFACYCIALAVRSIQNVNRMTIGVSIVMKAVICNGPSVSVKGDRT